MLVRWPLRSGVSWTRPQSNKFSKRSFSEATKDDQTNAPNSTTSARPTFSLQSANAYCQTSVQGRDHEHWLGGLLIKDPKSRASFFAIRAFNIEVLNILQTVRDPNLAQIRLAWWKTTIDDIYKGVEQANPITRALAEGIKEFKLTKGWFNKLLNSRSDELNSVAIRTLDQMERVAEDRVSSLQYLALESVGVKNVTADHVASHVGVAMGLVTLLRATPHNASQRRCYFPLNLMAQHSVSEEKLFRGEPDKGIEEVVFEVASIAKLHMDKAKELAPQIPRPAMTVLFPGVIADDYLVRLQNKGFNVFDPDLAQSNPFVRFKFLKPRFLGKF
eukprot:TRINITY_DN5111_c0_g1_i1.p1 TRINITY_DN5111_c0_g1~~TRINITY_DN5111_c0_g1_i1.p1  ORF type:complete len:331 (-),score=66.26 TRINITY_DN5111_c0_g1_i1:95-1087(-)